MVLDPCYELCLWPVLWSKAAQAVSEGTSGARLEIQFLEELRYGKKFLQCTTCQRGDLHFYDILLSVGEGT